MERKKAIKIGLVFGSLVGSYIPVLWGAGYFSVSSVLFTALGGILGIYLGYKLGN